MKNKQKRLTVPSHVDRNRSIGFVAPNSSMSAEDFILRSAEIEAANVSKTARQSVITKVSQESVDGTITDFVEEYENYIKNKVRDARTVSDLKDIIVEMAGDMAELSRKRNGINSP